MCLNVPCITIYGAIKNYAIQIYVTGEEKVLRLVSHMTVLKLHSDWRVEIPQRKPKDLAKITRPFSLVRVGSEHETIPPVIRLNS